MGTKKNYVGLLYWHTSVNLYLVPSKTLDLSSLLAVELCFFPVDLLTLSFSSIKKCLEALV